jgi:hypothetical protein
LCTRNRNKDQYTSNLLFHFKSNLVQGCWTSRLTTTVNVSRIPIRSCRHGHPSDIDLPLVYFPTKLSDLRGWHNWLECTFSYAALIWCMIDLYELKERQQNVVPAKKNIWSVLIFVPASWHGNARRYYLRNAVDQNELWINEWKSWSKSKIGIHRIYF